jgi:hypothetical protein
MKLGAEGSANADPLVTVLGHLGGVDPEVVNRGRRKPSFQVNMGKLETPALAWRTHLHSEIAGLAPNSASFPLLANLETDRVLGEPVAPDGLARALLCQGRRRRACSLHG